MEDKDETPPDGPQKRVWPGSWPSRGISAPLSSVPVSPADFRLQLAEAPGCHRTFARAVPVLASLLSYLPSHLDAPRDVTFFSGKSFLIPIIYIYPVLDSPKRQTEYIFCISGVSETRALLIFQKMLISEKSSWERQDFVKFHYPYLVFVCLF